MRHWNSCLVSYRNARTLVCVRKGVGSDLPSRVGDSRLGADGRPRRVDVGGFVTEGICNFVHC